MVGTIDRRYAKMAPKEPPRSISAIEQRGLITGQTYVLSLDDDVRPTSPPLMKAKEKPIVISGGAITEVRSPKLRRFKFPHIYASEVGPVSKDLLTKKERMLYTLRYSEEDRRRFYGEHFMQPRELWHSSPPPLPRIQEDDTEAPSYPTKRSETYASPSPSQTPEKPPSESDVKFKKEWRSIKADERARHERNMNPELKKDPKTFGIPKKAKTVAELNSDVYAQQIYLKAIDYGVATTRLDTTLRYRRRLDNREALDKRRQDAMKAKEGGFQL